LVKNGIMTGMSNLEHYYAVIIAGGGGTRLWPKSRKNTPKHLLKLIGDRTLIQTVYDAVLPIIPKERILVITNKDHLEKAKEQLPEIPAENWLAEPMAKGTTTAMVVAASYVHKRDENAVIMNLWADPLIPNVEGYQNAILSALSAAHNTNNIIAIAAKPTFPHIGLGYIHGDGVLDIPNYDGPLPIIRGLGFKEKPDLETAKQFVDSGEYFWNTGMYCWSTKTIFDAFTKHAPKYKELSDQLILAIGTPEEQNVFGKVFDEAENTTIDYAVSEKADNIAIVVSDFGWQDIGDWKVVYDVSNKDQDGNVVSNPENFIGLNTKNSLIECNGKLVVTVGVEDLVIIDSGDVIVVAHKTASQDIKKVVEKLKEEGKTELL
jgi:mannose-1-phosphate guanylyltransferase